MTRLKKQPTKKPAPAKSRAAGKKPAPAKSRAAAGKPAPAKSRAAAGKPAPAKSRAAAKKQAPAGKKPAVAAPPGPERVAQILTLLERGYPDATTALRWETPLQLLVATILSAQCTDERVNKVTPDLFAAYPTARDLAAVPTEELEQAIHSTGFFRAKARSIKGACAVLAEQYGGEVPRSIEELVQLPGVARKTANVVLGTAYGIASGVVVDTHVSRLAGRLGLSAETDANKIERDLMQVVPQQRWIAFAHQLILHGRAVCQARKPRCGECALAPHCPSAEQF